MFGIVSEVIEVFLKALSPIVINDSGKDTEVMPVLSLNALAAIEVTPDGIITVPVQEVLPVT